MRYYVLDIEKLLERIKGLIRLTYDNFFFNGNISFFRWDLFSYLYDVIRMRFYSVSNHIFFYCPQEIYKIS